jgi:hypothetical protein
MSQPSKLNHLPDIMKPSLTYSLLCGALLATSPGVAFSAEEPPTSVNARMARKDSTLVSLTASVQAIDQASREVTLKGPLGNTVTFTADPRVKRLDEIKVGDFVRADYYVSIAAEVRKPTAEEEKTPLVTLDAAGKAPPGTSPAAGGLRRFKVVTTVEGLDRSTETITVKGPRGNYLTARVAEPSRLTQLRIGETIVVTYTEALAVSLEKQEKKSLE